MLNINDRKIKTTINGGTSPLGFLPTLVSLGRLNLHCHRPNPAFLVALGLVSLLHRCVDGRHLRGRQWLWEVLRKTDKFSIRINLSWR